jgi:transcriptional regulator with XRE-family HTH domain
MKEFKLNEAFVNLRKATGKSQTKFAAELGLSKHTVISVENLRNGVSAEMQRRVFDRTGACLDERGGFGFDPGI